MKLPILSLNAQGLANKSHFKAFLRTCKKWSDDNIAHIFLIQEHNIGPNGIKIHRDKYWSTIEIEREALSKGFHLIIAMIPKMFFSI